MTNKLERDYQRLADLGAKLGIPVPQTFISMQVKMPNGEILVDRRQRSHTYTRNAYNHLFSEMAASNLIDATFGAGLVSLKGKSGTIIYGEIAFLEVNTLEVGQKIKSDRTFGKVLEVVKEPPKKFVEGHQTSMIHL